MAQQEFSEVDWAVVLLLLLFAVCLKLLVDITIRESRYLRWLTESGATILIGVFLGVVNLGLKRLTGTTFIKISPDEFSKAFSLALLPPICFAAGFSMKKREFFNNVGAILVFAVFGTIMSMLVIASGIWFLLHKGYITGLDPRNPVQCILFGCLLSATDTVATISVFQELNVDPLAYNIIFGESVLNDAIAIVLFKTSINFIGEDIFAFSTVVDMTSHFLVNAFGSLGIGLSVSVISAMTMKQIKHFNQPQYEVLWMVIFAFASYLLAEVANVSGILAVFLAGLMMSHYHWYTLSPDAQIVMLHLSSSLAFLCESLVSLSMGIMLLRVDTNISHWHFDFVVATLIMCVFSRVFNVFSLSALINYGRNRRNRIQFKHQILMVVAGLRGAVALILALQASAALKGNPAIVNATLVTVLFTILFVAPLTRPIVTALRIKTGRPGENLNVRTLQDDLEEDDFDFDVPAADGDEIRGSADGDHESDPGQPRRKGVRRRLSRLDVLWRTVDAQFIKPYMGGRPDDRFENHQPDDSFVQTIAEAMPARLLSYVVLTAVGVVASYILWTSYA